MPLRAEEFGELLRSGAATAEVEAMPC
jgi:hypothetical protein